MRVMHLVQGLDIGRTFGGAERAGVELARQLSRQGHVVTVCAFWRYHTDAEMRWSRYLEAESVRVIFASERHQTQNPLAFARAVHSIASQMGTRVDVVHAHHDGGALAALILKWTGHARVVLHTMHLPIEKQWGTSRFGALCRLLFTDALFPLLLDAETSIAPHFFDALRRRPIVRWLRRQANLLYIPLPFRFSPVESTLRPRGTCAEVTLGSVARLDALKGYGYLIDAFSILLHTFPCARLLLIGDGPARMALEQQAARLGIRERVTFAGQRDDLAACYGEMDVFVLPSLSEGVPTVVLESIASGVPVVATDLPGTRVLIQDGVSGWLVPRADAQALAAALTDALHDPLRAAERARHAKGVLEEFSIGAIGGEYEALYRRLLQA